MNRLQSVLTIQTLKEAFGIAIITMIIGNIAFYITRDDDEYENKKVKNKMIKLNIILFTTGFVLHYLIETIGLNKWYCDKCIV